MIQQLRHAYKQAPWRNQVRIIAWILLFLTIFVIIAIANLNVSAKTYATGIEIQKMKREKDTLTHQIADLRNQIGSATSFESMIQRASDAGYNTINDPERIVYLTVPGYQEPEIKIEVPRPIEPANLPVLKPSYTQSVWDLFLDGALKLRKNPLRDLP